MLAAAKFRNSFRKRMYSTTWRRSISSKLLRAAKEAKPLHVSAIVDPRACRVVLNREPLVEPLDETKIGFRWYCSGH